MTAGAGAEGGAFDGTKFFRVRLTSALSTPAVFRLQTYPKVPLGTYQLDFAIKQPTGSCTATYHLNGVLIWSAASLPRVWTTQTGQVIVPWTAPQLRLVMTLNCPAGGLVDVGVDKVWLRSMTYV